MTMTRSEWRRFAEYARVAVIPMRHEHYAVNLRVARLLAVACIRGSPTKLPDHTAHAHSLISRLPDSSRVPIVSSRI
jgi:hypothetical protein